MRNETHGMHDCRLLRQAAKFNIDCVVHNTGEAGDQVFTGRLYTHSDESITQRHYLACTCRSTLQIVKVRDQNTKLLPNMVSAV